MFDIGPTKRNELLVVDTSGVHRIVVEWCNCINDDPRYDRRRDLDLLKLGLYPASFKNIQTVFTFHVLDDFLLENLECKTSAMNYYSKLRRVTSKAFPEIVPDRYRELLRVSRQWRHLKYLKWHGFGHQFLPETNTTSSPITPMPMPISPSKGSMAIFCPTCPQEGINLPDNWKNDLPPWVLTRGYCMDGNFSAEHLRMRKPDDEVIFADGAGFFVAEKRYKDHLELAIEGKQASLCFRINKLTITEWSAQRDPTAMITRPLTELMPNDTNSNRLGLVQRPALGMDALSHIPSSTFKKAKGR
jgi:hypothetical protein